MQRAGQSQDFGLRETNIEWRILDGNIGYVKIRGELPTLPQLLPDSTVRRAMNAFVAAGVTGIVIDVRGNIGGADKLVPLMMGTSSIARSSTSRRRSTAMSRGGSSASRPGRCGRRRAIRASAARSRCSWTTAA